MPKGYVIGRARDVAIEFGDFAAARSCLFSPEYAEARKLREGAGEIGLVAVEGA